MQEGEAVVECSGKREVGGEIGQREEMGDGEKVKGQQEMPQFDRCCFSQTRTLFDKDDLSVFVVAWVPSSHYSCC